MRNVESEEILGICMAEIRSGRVIVEECLQRHADHASALEPLLREAVCLITLPPVTMPTDAVDALEQRVMIRAAEIRAATFRKEQPMRRPFWSRLVGRRVRLLPVVLSLVIALAVASTWTVSASASSLPGEALYPVKLVTEKARLAVTFRPEARAQLHLALAERRLGEMQTLLAEGRAVEEGLLDALRAETTQALEEVEDVGADRKMGVATKLLALTERQQAVLISVRARAPARAQTGLSRALEASRHGHERAMMALDMTPEPSPTPSASLTHTPHATPTHKPTHTPKSSHTPHTTSTRKPTHTPKPTKTSKPKG